MPTKPEPLTEAELVEMARRAMAAKGYHPDGAVAKSARDVEPLLAEVERLKGMLGECWDLLNDLSRMGRVDFGLVNPRMPLLPRAEDLLHRQQAPGWKE